MNGRDLPLPAPRDGGDGRSLDDFVQRDGRQHFSRETLIRDVPAIGNSHAWPPNSRDVRGIHEFVLNNVEQPLQPAVETLLLSGVRTCSSSANGRANSELGFSMFSLDYDSLSTRQKEFIDSIRAYLDADGIPADLVHCDAKDLASTALFIDHKPARHPPNFVTITMPTDRTTTLGFIEDESMKFVRQLIDAQ